MEPEECRPAQMPGLREDAIRALRWDAAKRALDRPARPGLGPGELSDDDRLALRMLGDADLYWISGDMSELCRDAVEDLTETHLGRDLWPSNAGFMLFETPVPVDGHDWRNANEQALEPVRAVAWYPEDDGLTVLLFVDASAMVQATRARLSDEHEPEPGWLRRNLDQLAATTGMRWLCPSGGDFHPLGDPVRLADHAGQGRPAAFMLSTVWLLMNQRGLAHVTTGVRAPKNKAARRRQAPDRRALDALRIVELRAGTDHASAYAGTTRAHRHRWMVRGHWRQQWYPSLSANRPVWIAPYLKGPAEAPLLTGDKVQVWKGR